MQPDSIIPNLTNPQSLNRYGYVQNNPVRFSDPTGHAEYEDTYEENDGVCDPGDTSCNWIGSGGGGNSGGNKPKNDANPYSDWNSNHYGGCFKCHAAKEKGEVALTNEQLAEAYSNFTTWQGIGYAPIALALAAVGGPAIGPSVYNAVGVTCLSSPNCVTVTGAAGGAGAQLTSNQIGQQGVQQVGQNLPINTNQYAVRNPLTGQLRIYDGQFINGGYVEIKTSLKGVTYATQFIRNQIAFDANMSPQPTWIFVNSNPSTPLMQLLNGAGIPWHVLHP